MERGHGFVHARVDQLTSRPGYCRPVKRERAPPWENPTSTMRSAGMPAAISAAIRPSTRFWDLTTRTSARESTRDTTERNRQVGRKQGHIHTCTHKANTHESTKKYTEVTAHAHNTHAYDENLNNKRHLKGLPNATRELSTGIRQAGGGGGGGMRGGRACRARDSLRNARARLPLSGRVPQASDVKLRWSHSDKHGRGKTAAGTRTLRAFTTKVRAQQPQQAGWACA